MTSNLFIALSSIAVAGSYYYYNWQYFHFVHMLTQSPHYPKKAALLCFLMNFSMFYVCTTLELQLMLNWALFAVFLLAETLLVNRGHWPCSLYSTTVGILSGLAINIFCRNLIAIIIMEPPVNFDNTVSNAGNLKSIPILFGFLLSGAALQLISRKIPAERQRFILKHPQHISFLLELMAGLLLNLFLNLLLYQQTSNSVLLKLWGMESCVFSIVGFYIGIWYTLRICQLTEYQVKNQEIAQTLVERQAEELYLREVVTQDALTGLYNRQKLLEEVSSRLQDQIPFTLCFLDLDGLKEVNDRFGHDQGDQYLLTVTGELSKLCRRNSDHIFRYGGDEFVVLFQNLTPESAAERVASLNAMLTQRNADSSFPYHMSVSYGIVESSGYSEADALLAEADAKMYLQKREKRRCRTEGDPNTQQSYHR